MCVEARDSVPVVQVCRSMLQGASQMVTRHSPPCHGTYMSSLPIARHVGWTPNKSYPWRQQHAPRYTVCHSSLADEGTRCIPNQGCGWCSRLLCDLTQHAVRFWDHASIRDPYPDAIVQGQRVCNDMWRSMDTSWKLVPQHGRTAS